MAQAIITRLKSTSIKGIKPNNKTLAQNALTVYESICARPPGWLATIGFGVLHAGSVVVALVLGLVLMFARGGTFAEFARAAAQQPQHRISPQEIVATPPQDAPSDQSSPTGHKTLIANFPTATAASSAFADFRPRLDPGQKLTRFGQTLLVSFPAEDDEARKKWLEIVAPRTKEFCVDGGTPFGGGRLRLMCLAPDAASAQAIEDELEEYFSAPSSFHLLPPWSAGAASSGQWAQYRLARKTYQRLISAGQNTRENPALKDLNKHMSEALRQGDTSEQKKLQAEREKLFARQQDEELAHLAALNDGSVDAEVVKEYIELQKKPVKDEENADEDDPTASLKDPHYQKMAARMGQIELLDDKPVNGSDRYTAKFGSVHRTSLLINIPLLNFQDAAEGAPAIVRWLDSRGCKGMKYEFEVGGRGLAY
jgi:hypothetical protein